jgi:hypothetical protein
MANQAGEKTTANRYINEETAMLGEALAVLRDWLAASGTARSVVNIAQHGGVWHVRLSAGGFVVESVTQETLGGAIRSAVQAAVVA